MTRPDAEYPGESTRVLSSGYRRDWFNDRGPVILEQILVDWKIILLDKAESQQLSQWLDRAYRKQLPPNLMELKKQRDEAEAAVGEMELPAETRRAMELFLALHQADTRLLYGVVESLFKRHLRGHHKPGQ